MFAVLRNQWLLFAQPFLNREGLGWVMIERWNLGVRQPGSHPGSALALLVTLGKFPDLSVLFPLLCSGDSATCPTGLVEEPADEHMFKYMAQKMSSESLNYLLLQEPRNQLRCVFLNSFIEV